MSRRIHPTADYFLKSRYQQKLITEKLDDGVDLPRAKQKAPGIKKKLGQGLMDVSDITGYTDFASKNLPFVERMAKVEVPLAEKNKKQYEKLRTDLATKTVQKRKEAFDKKIKIDETELLKNIIGENPELVHVLTRDEYESLAGGITNPLKLSTKVKDESGNQVEENTVELEMWPGIDKSAAIVYDFLIGAEETITDPKQLALAAAGGAAFRGAASAINVGLRGAAKGLSKTAQVISKTARNKAAQQAAQLAASGAQKISKFAPSAGAVITGVGGLGYMGYEGAQAAKEGQFSKYLGGLVGGVPGFAVGYHGAPYAGKAALGASKPVAKAATKTAKEVYGVGEDIFLQQQRNISAVQAKVGELLGPGGIEKQFGIGQIKRGRIPGQNPPTQQQKPSPKIPATQEPSTKPTSQVKFGDAARAAVLAASLLAGRTPKAEFILPRGEPIVSKIPTETITTKITAEPSIYRPGKAKETFGTKKEINAPKIEKTKTPSVENMKSSFVEKGKETSKDQSTTSVSKIIRDTPETPETTRGVGDIQTSRVSSIENSNIGRGEAGQGGAGRGGKKVGGKETTRIPGPTYIPPIYPPIPFGFGDSGRGGGGSLENAVRRISGNADVQAYLDRLFKASQTVRLR